MIKFTTSNNLEGYEIREYIKPVFFQTVVGMNVISDIFSSWTDFFGGQSGRYKDAMAKYTALVMREMEAKCIAAGGNYIIGFNIDYDEISGQGKSMLMVSGSGTAVSARRLKPQTDTSISHNEQLTGRTMQIELERIKWLSTYQTKQLSEVIDYAVQNQITEAALYILSRYKEVRKSANDQTEKVYEYFASFPAEKAKEILYSELLTDTESRNTAYEIIEALQLGSFEQAEQWLKSSDIKIRKAALMLYSAEITDYSTITPAQIENHIKALTEAFHPVSEIMEEKIIFSGTRNVWKCTCGMKVESNKQYCFECGDDIYGFRQGEKNNKKVIKLMEMRKQILEKRYASK